MSGERLSREEWLQQRLAVEKEARLIAERRSRAYQQQAKRLKEKLTALGHLTAEARQEPAE
jgi:hypothetical protein